MAIKDEFIQSMILHPGYKPVMEELKKSYPVLPEYDGTNVEQWKENSLKRQGYKLCLSILKMEIRDD